MRNDLAVLAGLLVVYATFPYIRDTIRGKTHPNVITWFTWSLLSGITAIAVYSGGAKQTAIFAGSLAICDVVIVVSSLRFGVRRYTGFDVICQLLAIVGIILWRLTNQPALAVVLVIISDLIGVLPTYKHIWLAPHEETLKTFVIATAASIIAIVSLANYGFVSSAYPIYILFSSVSLVSLIVVSRKHKANLKIGNA